MYSEMKATAQDSLDAEGVVIGNNWKIMRPETGDSAIKLSRSDTEHQLKFSSAIKEMQEHVSEEKLTKNLEVRKYIVQELWQTEQNYVSNLSVVLDHFKTPLLKSTEPAKSIAADDMIDGSGGGKSKLSFFSGAKAKKPSAMQILPLVDINVMFFFIDELYSFSRDLCVDMERVVSSWAESEKIWTCSHNANNNLEPLSIACLFDRDWDLYLKFVNNYSLARETIMRHETDNLQFREFIELCDRLPECKRIGVLDFLILPIQRVTRYVLLLRDLQSHTPECHPEFQGISASLDKMQKLAAAVNQVKKQEEEITSMFQVMRVEGAPPTLLSAHRRVLSQCSIFSQDPRTHCKLFLFNDLIMLTRKKRKDSLYRIAWHRDIDLEQTDYGSFKLSLPTNVDVNVFMTELASANASASAAITPRSSSKNTSQMTRVMFAPLKQLASRNPETISGSGNECINTRSTSLKYSNTDIGGNQDHVSGEHVSLLHESSKIAKRNSSLGRSSLAFQDNGEIEVIHFEFEDKKSLKDFMYNVQQLAQDGKLTFRTDLNPNSL